MALYSTHPLFLDSSLGKIFVIQYKPDGEPLGSVIFVPPFAEEMNKCRPMMTRQARRLAELGFSSIVFDLYGTGDSDGDFGEAAWGDWVADLYSVAKLTEFASNRPVWLIGIRLGAHIALELLRDGSVPIDGAIFWNAVTKGKIFMNQFLRLKLASELTVETEQRQTVNELRDELANNKTIEIAGYDVGNEIVTTIDKLDLHLLPKSDTKIWMLEATENPSLALSPAILRVKQHAMENGVDIELLAVEGPPFWATQEIAIAPKLIEQTNMIVVGAA